MELFFFNIVTCNMKRRCTSLQTFITTCYIGGSLESILGLSERGEEGGGGGARHKIFF